MNKINNISNFTNYGYQIVKKLGHNQEHSIITWLGTATDNNTPVVIKQFRFATKDSSWSGYQAYQREIELLKKLNYPGIPKYIADFETDNSFCFVREYIEGTTLAEQTSLTETSIKIIAVKVLNILSYFQQQQPPILHLNITPNNILIDRESNVYLIDFSLAQRANSLVDCSLIKTSNAQFIAPEQIKTPCKASDLYGLGCTLNSIITKLRSLLLSNNSVNNSASLLELDSGFQEWLDTMTQLELTERYPDAETALKALQASSWEDIAPLIKTTDEIALSNRAFATGIITMIILGIAIAVGFDVSQTTEKSLTNITIAAMGMVIIYLTQSASATLITNDNAEKKQGLIIAIALPILLTIVTGIIFGSGEAVAMSLAAIIAQTATLGYVLLQKLPLSQQGNILKMISLVIAIAFGLVCGTVVF